MKTAFNIGNCEFAAVQVSDGLTGQRNSRKKRAAFRCRRCTVTVVAASATYCCGAGEARVHVSRVVGVKSRRHVLDWGSGCSNKVGSWCMRTAEVKGQRVY